MRALDRPQRTWSDNFAGRSAALPTHTRSGRHTDFADKGRTSSCPYCLESTLIPIFAYTPHTPPCSWPDPEAVRFLTSSLPLVVPDPSPRPHPVSYTHLRAHETPEHLVCRL